MITENFYFGASPEIIRRARLLRLTMTYTEEILWERLRNFQVKGVKFRRQHPISRFIVDFYCHELKLVIELDGNVHQEEVQQERDVNRTYELEELGLTVLRYENNIVKTNIASIIKEIETYLK